MANHIDCTEMLYKRICLSIDYFYNDHDICCRGLGPGQAEAAGAARLRHVNMAQQLSAGLQGH